MRTTSKGKVLMVLKLTFAERIVLEDSNFALGSHHWGDMEVVLGTTY